MLLTTLGLTGPVLWDGFSTQMFHCRLSASLFNSRSEFSVLLWQPGQLYYGKVMQDFLRAAWWTVKPCALAFLHFWCGMVLAVGSVLFHSFVANNVFLDFSPVTVVICITGSSCWICQMTSDIFKCWWTILRLYVMCYMQCWEGYF